MTDITNPYFWNCKCTSYYIHAKCINEYCITCNTLKEDQPDSISSEILQGIEGNTALFHTEIDYGAALGMWALKNINYE